jgi:hypothetical protein
MLIVPQMPELRTPPPTETPAAKVALFQRDKIVADSMPDHVVKQGECLFSIAAAYGFDWRRVWALGENAQLKHQRKLPNILYPGDRLFIPDRQLKEEPRPTEQKHRFLYKALPYRLRIRLLAAGKPLANEAYILEIAGKHIEGTTDADGRLDQPIPPDAPEGRLLIGESKIELQLTLGHLDPLEEISGVQGRLNNLGYNCGAVDGVLGPKTASALKAFQETYALPITGEPDEATGGKLKELHGC